MPEQQVAPRQSHRWLRKLLPARLQPFVRGLRIRWRLRNMNLPEPYRTAYPFTCSAMSRQENLVRLCEEFERDGVKGAIVECGVLDGGASALMAWATKGSDRPVHMFDAWRGLPDATEQDGADADGWVGQVVGSPSRVRKVMRKLKIDPRRLHFHHGWFHETFPDARIDRIALLHIDCDFYEPTVLCLERWYPHLVPGGCIQFDDYFAFQGCRKAVDEFLEAHPELELIVREGPARVAFLRKPKDAEPSK